MKARWILVLLLTGSCAEPVDFRAVYQQAFEQFRRGDLQQAEQLVAAAEQRPEAAGDWPLRLLRAEIHLAQGDAARATALVENALPPPDTGGEIKSRWLKVRGHAALNLNQHAEAERLFQEALSAGATASLQLEVDLLRGLLLLRTGRESDSAAATRAVYQRAVELRDDYWLAAAGNNLGLERMRALRFDQAIPLLDQALEAARAANALRFAAASLANLGSCHYRIGDFDRALELLTEAARIQEEIGALAGLQSSLGEIGNVYYIQGRADLAVPFYERALTLSRTHAPWDTWSRTQNLAAAHVELKQWDEAERIIRETAAVAPAAGEQRYAAYAKLHAATIAAGRKQFDAAIRLFEETLTLATENIELQWVANAGLGQAYASVGAPQQARAYFERCLETIAGARNQLGRAEHRLTFFSRVLSFYQDYIELLLTEGQPERALQVADSSRAVLLSERLQLTGGSRPAVTAAALQRAARTRNTVYLSYWLAPERSLLWVVNAREMRVFDLPPRDRITHLVDGYREFLETSLRDPISAGYAPARELYDTLVAPARRLIPEGASVTVVGDGPLHSLNLETLPVFDESPHYLIEDFVMTVAPSLTLAIDAPTVRVGGNDALLVVGDPTPAGRDFPRLTGAAREIDAIRTQFGAERTTTLTGRAATATAYRNAGPERFSVIHFAAHATANRASPLDSAVVLSPHESGYLLTARDVLEHRLQADLVTLSACRSAGARIYGGEGIVGFAWAFLQAGARSVVAGLWDVSDRSTSQLMEELYSGLHAGLPPAAALREAKLSLIRSNSSFANPYYWGPFQLYIGGGTRARPPSTS